MMENEQERMQQLLTMTMRPVADEDGAELRHDLWPAMLNRLEAPPARVPWFDWALLAGIVGSLLFFPRAIPLILYYL